MHPKNILIIICVLPDHFYTGEISDHRSYRNMCNFLFFFFTYWSATAVRAICYSSHLVSIQVSSILKRRMPTAGPCDHGKAHNTEYPQLASKQRRNPKSRTLSQPIAHTSQLLILQHVTFGYNPRGVRCDRITYQVYSYEEVQYAPV